MNVNNMTKYAVGILIGLVMLAGLLIPIVEDAQNNAGDTVTYTNGNLYGYHLGNSKDAATLTFNATDGWKYNGESATEGLVLVSDYVSIRLSNNGREGVITSPVGSWDIRTSWSNSPTTIIFENGKVTLDIASSTPTHHEWQYTWLLQPKDGGEWQTKGGMYTVYANSIKDVLAVGYYNTGDNDTAYCFKDGKLTTVVDYETNVSYTQTKVEGTTDVYQLSNLSLSVGNESFTPWFVLVKSEITGHEVEQTYSTIYGVIPLVAIIGLVIFAASAIRARRY